MHTFISKYMQQNNTVCIEYGKFNEHTVEVLHVVPCINPLLPSAAFTYATECHNSDFNLRRDHQKNSYEISSVDEKSLS